MSKSQSSSLILVFGFLSILPETGALAAEGSPRKAHRFGIFASGTTEKFYMGNVGFNATDFLRMRAGYGKKSFDMVVVGTPVHADVSLISVGAVLLVPKWSLSPFVGADYVKGEATVQVAGLSVKADASGMTYTGGLDFTSRGGLNLGGFVLVDDSETAGGGYVGWYF